MFGADAQILPGLTFADLFRNIIVTDGETNADGVRIATEPNTSVPMQWSFRVVGIDDLMRALGTAPGQVNLKDLIEAAKSGQDEELSIPVKFGIEAGLNWTNRAFEPVDLGAVKFTPKGDTVLELNALASMDSGFDGLPLDFSNFKLNPARATLTSHAQMTNFTVEVFGAIELDFRSVSFEMGSDGQKSFNTDIADVRLIGPLAFVNQLSKAFGGLGGGYGIDIDISPANVRIGQTLRFPKEEGQPLFIGPAQVTNLTLTWGVKIPLSGRDVLSASFALSSRENPLTIFVPPWYGGRAYMYLEVTTGGIRLLEFSMEYGALIPVTWGGIAKGEAGVMAGIFYSVQRTAVGGSVTLRAFVKAFANLSVAGLIHFSGLIYIALEDSGGKSLKGTCTVTVSIKIGFIRYSYSFTAEREEKQGGTSSENILLQFDATDAPNEMLSPAAFAPFPEEMSVERINAFHRIVSAYV
jgi:hypothetical protein